MVQWIQSLMGNHQLLTAVNLNLTRTKFPARCLTNLWKVDVSTQVQAWGISLHLKLKKSKNDPG